MMLRLYLPEPWKNRWYVVDLTGNKLYYGTKAQCRKFIKYMEGSKNNVTLDKR